MAQDGKLLVRATPTRAVSFADVVKQTGMPQCGSGCQRQDRAARPLRSASDASGGNKKGHSANAADNTGRQGRGKAVGARAVRRTPRTKVAAGGAMPDAIAADIPADSNADQSQYAFQSFGAQFVEVRVNPNSGEIRVARVVNVFDIGRVLNPKTARSQISRRRHNGHRHGDAGAHRRRLAHPGRIMNADLAEYHVPVHADIPHFDVYFLDIPDPHINPLGCARRGRDRHYGRRCRHRQRRLSRHGQARPRPAHHAGQSDLGYN